jgi:hypothetical protein
LKKLFACALVMVALASGIADASHQDINDPNDTDGKLDIKKVASFGTQRPARKITTFSSWTTREMRDSGYFTVWYDTRFNSRFDYFVLARSIGRKMEGTLWRDFASRPDRVVGDAQVWRTDDRSVTIRISLDQMVLGDKRQSYRWAVESIRNGGSACGNVCFDRAPDSGVVVEPIPLAAP